MQSTIGQQLHTHQKIIKNTHLKHLFNENPNRFEQFSVQASDILLDFSKQKVTQQTLKFLCTWAVEKKLALRKEELFSGVCINTSEHRPALHTALRDPSKHTLLVNGQDIKPDIHAMLNKMESMSEALRTGTYLGSTGKAITDVLCLGIGGSDLGPRMVCSALRHAKTTSIRLHFISNVDAYTVEQTLAALEPAHTLCIINSKTFTTLETMLNAKSVQQWFRNFCKTDQDVEKHLWAVTAHVEGALRFGIVRENIFEFWSWVGGRYSIWSAVGLPVAILLGMPVFREFLSGAHEMDVHFKTAPIEANMPVLMALLGIWNINFLGYHSQAILPYDDGLNDFPAYLQQLDMESNGKSLEKNGEKVMYSTAPLIWGGVGCNGQHAYMQLLHQGTEIIPVDFLIAIESNGHLKPQHHALVASCLSQSKALMEGSTQHGCLGNRPSNTLMYPMLNAKTLGALLALYEHKVFVQGIMWNINSFDQPGVELGKVLTETLLPFFENENLALKTDSSTEGLVAYYKRYFK